MISFESQTIGYRYDCVCDVTGKRFPHSELERGRRDWVTAISDEAMSLIPRGMARRRKFLHDLWRAIISTFKEQITSFGAAAALKPLWEGSWLCFARDNKMIGVPNDDMIESVILSQDCWGKVHLFNQVGYVKTFEIETKVDWAEF